MPCWRSPWAILASRSLSESFTHSGWRSLQRLGLVQIVADELVQPQALDPPHLQERIPLLADADSRLDVVELDHEAETGPSAECSLIPR